MKGENATAGVVSRACGGHGGGAGPGRLHRSEVRQQEGFLGMNKLVSVFRRPEPGTHIWVDIHRTQVSVFASVVSPHLDCKPVASPAFA